MYIRTGTHVSDQFEMSSKGEVLDELRNVAILLEKAAAEREADLYPQLLCKAHSTPQRPIYIDNFCEACRVLVCHKCIHSPQHSSHKQSFRDALDVLPECAGRLQALANGVATEADSVKREQERIQERHAKNRDEMARVIEAAYEKMLALLRKRKDGLLAAVHENVADKLAVLQQNLKTLEESKKCVDQTNKEVEQTLQNEDLSVLAKEQSLTKELQDKQQAVQEMGKTLSGSTMNLGLVLRFEEGINIDHYLSTFGHLTECQCDLDSTHSHPPLRIMHELRVGNNGETYIATPHDLRSQHGYGMIPPLDHTMPPLNVPYPAYHPAMQAGSMNELGSSYVFTFNPATMTPMPIPVTHLGYGCLGSPPMMAGIKAGDMVNGDIREHKGPDTLSQGAMYRSVADPSMPPQSAKGIHFDTSTSEQSELNYDYAYQSTEPPQLPLISPPSSLDITQQVAVKSGVQSPCDSGEEDCEKFSEESRNPTGVSTPCRSVSNSSLQSLSPHTSVARPLSCPTLQTTEPDLPSRNPDVKNGLQTPCDSGEEDCETFSEESRIPTGVSTPCRSASNASLHSLNSLSPRSSVARPLACHTLQTTEPDPPSRNPSGVSSPCRSASNSSLQSFDSFSPRSSVAQPTEPRPPSNVPIHKPLAQKEHVHENQNRKAVYTTTQHPIPTPRLRPAPHPHTTNSQEYNETSFTLPQPRSPSCSTKATSQRSTPNSSPRSERKVLRHPVSPPIPTPCPQAILHTPEIAEAFDGSEQNIHGNCVVYAEETYMSDGQDYIPMELPSGSPSAPRRITSNPNLQFKESRLSTPQLSSSPSSTSCRSIPNSSPDCKRKEADTSLRLPQALPHSAGVQHHPESCDESESESDDYYNYKPGDTSMTTNQPDGHEISCKATGVSTTTQHASTPPLLTSKSPACPTTFHRSTPNSSPQFKAKVSHYQSPRRPLPQPPVCPPAAVFSTEPHPQAKPFDEPAQERHATLKADQMDEVIYDHIYDVPASVPPVANPKTISTFECPAYGRVHTFHPRLNQATLRSYSRPNSVIIKPVRMIENHQFRQDSITNVCPSGVCCTGTYNNIIVTDVSNHCLRMVDQNGSSATKIGRKGGGDGCFDTPVALAVSRDNFIYVADQKNARIQKFSTVGTLELKFGEKKGRQILRKPQGIAVRQATGDLYVADSEKKRVYVYQSDGTYLRPIGKYEKPTITFNCPVAVTISKSDHLLVVDRSSHGSGRHCVWCIRQPEEELVRKIGEGVLENPSGIAVTQDGTILVTELDRNSVCVFSEMGELIHRFGQTGIEPGMFNQPCGICVNNEGQVVVADKGNNRVQVFLLNDILKK